MSLNPWSEVTCLCPEKAGAYISCQDEPDLAFTRIKWQFGVGSESLGEDRTFDTPKTYGLAGRLLGEITLPCRALVPGKAGTPALVGASLSVKLWDTEGRKWEAYAVNRDTIMCPRKPS